MVFYSLLNLQWFNTCTEGTKDLADAIQSNMAATTFSMRTETTQRFINTVKMRGEPSVPLSSHANTARFTDSQSFFLNAGALGSQAGHTSPFLLLSSSVIQTTPPVISQECYWAWSVALIIYYKTIHKVLTTSSAFLSTIIPIICKQKFILAKGQRHHKIVLSMSCKSLRKNP